MDKGNILEGVRGLIGNVPNSFSVLEEEIDIDLQFEYFKQAKKLRTERQKAKKDSVVDESNEQHVDFDVLESALYDDACEIEEKKKILVQIASSQGVKTFRILEKYKDVAPEDLSHWTSLALQESKMHLESSLLDENQVFISTGMGGKGDKLRYSVALRSASEEILTEIQQQVILREAEFALNAEESELENIRFEEEFAIIKVLVPMSKDINNIFKQCISACNDLGKFLHENFVVTNVKEFSVEKLRKFQQAKVEGENSITPELPFETSGNLKDIIEEIKKVISQKISQIGLDEDSKDQDEDDNGANDEEPEE